MGKGGDSGPSAAVQQGELNNSTALTAIAAGQAKNANQLYQLTEPGLAQSENFYQTLASGDPAAIMRAIAPTAQGASDTATTTKANILATAPTGGEKNLALEQVQAGQGSTIAKAISGATTGSENALGALAGQGIGESLSAAGTAVSGLGTANTGLNNLGNQQLAAQQIQAEEKGNVLGAVGELAGAGATLGAGAMTSSAIAGLGV